MSHQKLEIIVKMESKTVEKPREDLNKNADVIVLISDDEDDVVEVKIEQKMESVETVVKKESAEQMETAVKGEGLLVEQVEMTARGESLLVEQMEMTTKGESLLVEQVEMTVKGGSLLVEQVETVKHAEEAAETGSQECGLYDDNTLFSFIRRYCCNNTSCDTSTHISGPSLPPIFSPTHPKDIIQACYQTPYCLYLYVGVELGGGRSTSVVMIGYVEQSSGLSVVRLLHTLQLSVDSVHPWTSADMDTNAAAGMHNADTDARLLVETLQKFVLPLSNLVMFYCDAPHPAVSRVFESHFQAFNPRLVSLCGLPGMAGRACQAGLLASFRHVVDLIRDVHHHYSTCASINDSLKEVFADADSYNPFHPVSAQCLFIISIVQKMVSSWRDLVEYFKSLRRTDDADRIGTALMDHKVKLHFLFFSHALQPLRVLQELQQSGTVDMAGELHLISMLLRTYTVSLLRPCATERFLRKWDLRVLHSEKELLPTSEVDIGSFARDFLWATPVVDLGEQDRSDFLKGAAAFYKAALESLVKSIPKSLGDMTLMNISKVLKHPDNINVRTFLSLTLSES